MIHGWLKPREYAPWKLILAVLCLAVVVLGSTAQVAHTHAGGDISHADCSLCVTAHVVAQVVANPTPLPATLVVCEVTESAPKVRRAWHGTFALFTRPPPPPVPDFV